MGVCPRCSQNLNKRLLKNEESNILAKKKQRSWASAGCTSYILLGRNPVRFVINTRPYDAFN